jgi:transposase-like protein
MKQAYHTNATTNVHTRALIKNSVAINSAVGEQYGVSVSTVTKWQQRECLQDVSSRPHRIDYALTELEMSIALSVRRSSWISLDEVYEILLSSNPLVSRSSVYRLFVRNSVNRIPQKEKDKAKKFKEYEPGFLHVDVTYLPQFNGQKYYLFVAIDRATRAMFYKVYDTKAAESTELFIEECLLFFPFTLSHILTDNGLEFTNRLINSKKGVLCTKKSKLDQLCEREDIKHRLTKPFSPQTNGMVERVNGTIKSNTILRNQYDTISRMNEDLTLFLINYNLYRRHGGLRREINVKTPIEAVEKWKEIKPELFHKTTGQFRNIILNLKTKEVRLA